MPKAKKERIKAIKKEEIEIKKKEKFKAIA